MSDHKAKAEELLVDALNARTGSDVEQSRQMQALVHATLALAEEQRTANIIAAAQLDVARGVRHLVDDTLEQIERRMS